MKRLFLVITTAALCVVSHAQQVEFEQTAEPDATAVSVATQDIDTGTSVISTTAPETHNTDTFTHWTTETWNSSLNGGLGDFDPATETRREDGNGYGINPFTFTLFEKTRATAHYLPTAQDDGDGVPDWWEMRHLNTLSNGATYDADGDGVSMLDEYLGGKSPAVYDIRFSQVSSPTGHISEADQWYTTAQTVATTSAPVVSGAYHFTHWEVPGLVPTRQADAWGRAVNPVSWHTSVTVEATVYYLDEATDADTDSIPDWYELEYFGDIATQTATADGDLDGADLSAEYAAGTNPLFADSINTGGIVLSVGETAVINMAGWSRYTISSIPEGTVDEQSAVPEGTEITTTDLSGTANFAYWELNGVRQEDAQGIALTQLTFIVGTENVEGVAYLISGDSDSDGVDDWWEQRYLGTLANDASYDGDGDGVSMLDEFTNGKDPVNKNWAITEVSNPAAIVSEATSWYVGASNVHTTSAAPTVSGSNHFTHWQVPGQTPERRADAWGRSTNPSAFTVSETLTATAQYLDKSLDSDADGLPDWYEQEYYGSLANPASSDGDLDGVPLAQEYAAGTNPLFADSINTGGIVLSVASQVEVNLAAFPTYSFTENPSGTVLGNGYADAGTVITSPDMSGTATFGYWTLDGTRQENAEGIAVTQFSFNLDAGGNVAVAYLFAGDTDTDGVDDWWEQRYLGTLANSASYDGDSDGVSMLDEFNGGKDPVHFDALITETSSPVGVVDESTSWYSGLGDIHTTTAAPTVSGVYRFTQWEVPGQTPSRLADAWGRSVNPAVFAINQSTTATATYLDEVTDSDGDSLPDWFEQEYFGGLGLNGSSDTDVDGATLAEEYAVGTNPLFADSINTGGIVLSVGGNVRLDMQAFERIRFVKDQGQLDEAFSFEPNTPAKVHGTNVAPVLCDWDGDGDNDFFLATETGLTVYENIGSKYTVNLADRSAYFLGIDALVGSVTRPVLSAGDWNLDGNQDLALGGQTGDVLLIASPGDFGGGQPSAASVTVNTGGSSALPAFGHADGDNQIDLFILLDTGNADRYSHTGNSGTPYSTATAGVLDVPMVNARGFSTALTNTDEDDLLDLLASDEDGRTWEYRGDGAGGYELRSKVWAGTGAGFASGFALSAGDWDGDGDYDGIAGTAGGALVGLRDPKLGLPSGLAADPGSDSILINWDANRVSRVKGYNIHRANSAAGPFEKINATFVRKPEYLDSTASSITRYYRVTAVTETYRPGSSIPVVVESLPSETVSTRSGRIRIAVPNRFAQAGTQVEVPVFVANALNLSHDLRIRLGYDNTVLTPVRVEKNRLSANLVIADSVSATEWTVSGTSGSLSSGRGALLTFVFEVTGGGAADLTLNSASFKSTDGSELEVISTNGSVSVHTTYYPGDVNGDGVITQDDAIHLKTILRSNTAPPTADEKAAGDLNADGRLDVRDRILLKRLLAGKAITL